MLLVWKTNSGKELSLLNLLYLDNLFTEGRVFYFKKLPCQHFENDEDSCMEQPDKGSWDDIYKTQGNCCN
jgi:hypothetical protein